MSFNCWHLNLACLATWLAWWLPVCGDDVFSVLESKKNDVPFLLICSTFHRHHYGTSIFLIQRRLGQWRATPAGCSVQGGEKGEPNMAGFFSTLVWYIVSVLLWQRSRHACYMPDCKLVAITAWELLNDRGVADGPIKFSFPTTFISPAAGAEEQRGFSAHSENHWCPVRWGRAAWWTRRADHAWGAR